MIRRRHSIFICLLIVSLLFATRGWATEFPALTLDKPTHFTAPDGTDVLVAAGAYRIERAAGTNLRLVTEAHPAIREISTASFTHEESLIAPLAIVARTEQQEMIVPLLLFLPGGQGLHLS